MARQTAADFDPEVLRLFDQYVHGVIDRRGFLERAARYAAGATGAVALLASLSPKFAEAQVVKPDDARIVGERTTVDSPDGYGKVSAYLVKPAQADGALPGVLVVHENRGLNPHIEDVARRLALAGYVALAPDGLSSVGGYPGDEDAARAKFGTLDQEKLRADFLAAARWLRMREGGNGKLGATGFCWGGGMVNWLATHGAALDAAAPFYGPAPALEGVDLTLLSSDPAALAEAASRHADRRQRRRPRLPADRRDRRPVPDRRRLRGPDALLRHVAEPEAVRRVPRRHRLPDGPDLPGRPDLQVTWSG